jgi:hypothetical protein
MQLKQLYDRKYIRGRATAGWERGERITSPAQLKPGDYVIEVSHQFKAENLARVVPLPEGFSPVNSDAGFYSEWADNVSGKRYDGQTMFTWHWEFDQPEASTEIYRAIDRRPADESKTRIPASELPTWLSYKQ